jgi:PAS domain S-box-containing protein
MNQKPSYEELKQKVKVLELEVARSRQTEEALQEIEDRYCVLADHVADGVSLIQDGKIKFVNEAFASMYGYSHPSQLVGKQATDLICQEFKEQFSRIYEAIISGISKERIFKGKCISKDDREFWIEEHYNIIHWDGKPALLGTARDITKSTLQEIEMKKDAEHLKKTKKKLEETLKDRYRFGELIGKSLPMQKIYNLILEASGSNAGVVIYGESGTGKELIAETIHDMSSRHEMAFVPVNCGAIPESIFESEFFGHRKGAYTSADSDKPGFFDMADKGTLFLDEVSELSLNMQVKLLRAIEGGGYTPVGGNKARFSDFRIIAATNENLINHVKIGKMREDFFYRIHIIPIHVPPLKERQEDIPLLLDHFLELYSTQKQRPKIPGKIMEILRHYNWPGNVRELQNVLQRYIAIKKLDLLDSCAFWNRENNDDSRYYNEHGDIVLDEFEKHNFNLRDAVKNYEKSIITQALDQSRWNRNKASEMLGVPLRTLSRKMKDYRLL